MFSAFTGTLFTLLILIGTVAICYCFMLKLLLPKQKRDYYIILPCDKDTKKVREKAYGMRLKLNLLGDDLQSKVVVLDGGIDDGEKEHFMKICKDCNGIYIIEKDKLKDFFDDRI